MFKKYTRPIKNYLKYRDTDFDPVEFLVFEDRKLVLLVISKVACTSIKATIGKSYDIDFKNDSGLDIHSKESWARCFGHLPKRYENYEVAAFVRNPFSRLVSCYKDRVIYDYNHADFSKYYFQNYPFGIQANSEFVEFVQSVAEIPDASADRHFKMQSYSFNKLGRPLDFVGRFENLTEDWKHFSQRYGFCEDLARLNPSDRYRKDLKRDYRDYYDSTSLQIVYERYQQDIKDFSYEEDFQNLKKYIKLEA